MHRKNDWYEIRASGKDAEILIYGNIGESWSDEYVTAKDFVTDLQNIESKKITIRVNSYGGSVSDGLAIHNALKRHPATIYAKIDGVAVSIASLIVMAADEIEMAENALFMIHAPWGAAIGNATDMREHADLLDKFASGMASSYANKSGKSVDEILDLLKDGKDHWFTAHEALEAGFVDVVGEALQIAASFDLSRFHNIPAAAAVIQRKEIKMPQENEVAAQPQAVSNVAPAAPENKSRSKAQSEEIRASFAPFMAREGVSNLLIETLADTELTVAQARENLLAKLGEKASPANPATVETVADETDKRNAAIVDAIVARLGNTKIDASNPFRGIKLLDVAKMSLDHGKISYKGRNQMEIVAAAFTQSTSDFPVLLENAMNKTLRAAYDIAPDTWSRFSVTSSVSDFRAHNRYRLGSFGNLDALNELGEFKNKAIPDGEKSSISISTKGNVINLSRQAIINDDIGAFLGLSGMLGRAARRSIEADVYALLASNPVMADGFALFSTQHANLATTPAAVTIDSIEAGRQAIAKQKDISGNDFLDLRPEIFVGGMGTGGDARMINEAQYDPDTANKLQRPNKVRGLFRDVVDSPRITGTEWYLFVNPSVAPVIDVAFLDGNQEPYLELQNGFDVDGARWKVRLDYGVAAAEFKGGYKNAGV